MRRLLGFSTQELWSLFLMAAFPTHVWAILLALQDFSWIAERNNNWDALSVGAYGLVVALLESIFVFVLVLTISFLVPRKWGSERRVAIISTLVMVAGIWAILTQLYFLLGTPFPGSLLRFLIARSHPLRVLYGLCLVLVTPTVVLPIYGLYTSEKVLKVTLSTIERLSLLTTLYLLADLGSVIIVLIRNL